MILVTGATGKVGSALVEQLVRRLALTSEGTPPSDGVRRAAVAALLHDTPDRTCVLLMKRVERTGDPWSGHISLPGGGYHAEDADLLATAIRETREELGIDLTSARMLGHLPPLLDAHSQDGAYVTLSAAKGAMPAWAPSLRSGGHTRSSLH